MARGLGKKNVTGADKVARVFKGLPREMIVEITHALNKGAEEVRDRAKRLAPVDSHDLENAIEVRTSLKENGGITDKGRRFSPQISRLIGVFPETAGGKAYYARWVEFGTNQPGGTAQPFLFPAYWSIRTRVRGRIKRAVKKAARDAAKRGR